MFDEVGENVDRKVQIGFERAADPNDTIVDLTGVRLLLDPYTVQRMPANIKLKSTAIGKKLEVQRVETP